MDVPLLCFIECDFPATCRSVQSMASTVRLNQDLVLGHCDKCGKHLRWTKCLAIYIQFLPYTGPDVLIEFRNYHNHRHPPGGRLNIAQEETLADID